MTNLELIAEKRRLLATLAGRGETIRRLQAELADGIALAYNLVPSECPERRQPCAETLDGQLGVVQEVVKRLQAELDDASETLQLFQTRGDYEVGTVLGYKAAMERCVRDVFVVGIPYVKRENPMNATIAELQNLANGCEASGDRLAARICRDGIVEIERARAAADQLTQARLQTR